MSQNPALLRMSATHSAVDLPLLPCDACGLSSDKDFMLGRGEQRSF